MPPPRNFFRNLEVAAGNLGPEAAWEIITTFRPEAPRTHRGWQRLVAAARRLFYLPAAGGGEEHLLSVAEWNRLAPPAVEAALLPALSLATGIYFFPTREWLHRCCRFLELLRSRRVLEAGAGRGYLAAALAPRLAARGIAFLAVEKTAGAYDQGLPHHPVVQPGDALLAVHQWRPDIILYAWPPPGQSIAPLCRPPWVRFVLVLGEPGGGCTGDPRDWQRLAHRTITSLSRLSWARSGRQRQSATLFYGAGHPAWREPQENQKFQQENNLADKEK